MKEMEIGITGTIVNEKSFNNGKTTNNEVKNNKTEKEVKSLFKDGEIGEQERGFLEDLLEAIPNVDSSEDVGSTIEYYDEYGSTLFCVDFVGEDSYLFRFYHNSYPVSGEMLKKIEEILTGSEREETEINI